MGQLQKQTNRFLELEGLRGIAAVIVALYHNLLAFYALAFFGAGSAIQHQRFEDDFYGNPLAALLSGTFAVAIFFVLSGFVLSIGFFQTKNSDIIKKLAIKRYPRLMLPALISTVLCFALITLGLSFTQPGAAITGSSWLAVNWHFDPSFLNAIWTAAVGIYTEGKSSYNNVLWTMQTEFIGSFIVFAALLLTTGLKYRWALYAVLAVVFFNSWFLGFIIGMIFADAYNSGFIRQQKRSIALIAPMILGAIVLGGYPIASTEGTMYHLPASNLQYLIISTTLGAALLVYALLWSSQLGSVLRKKHVSKLGTYTFSLYLVHIPILYSFTVGIFLLLQPHTGYNLAVVSAIGLSIPVVAGATVLFEKYVDRRAIAAGSYVSDIVFGKRQLPNITHVYSKQMRKVRRFARTFTRKPQIQMMGELEE